MKRIGLLVIGDEILAGHTQDTNTHWLAKRCQGLGVRLARVEVCSDDLDDIRTSIRRFLDDLDLDYVITSGGLGPTHDDRTMEGLAAALGVQLVLRDEHRRWMTERVAFGHKLGYFKAREPNAGHLKMAMLPEGADAMPNAIGTCLGAIIRGRGPTLFTLPGVPQEFQRMFIESVEPLVQRGPPAHVAELVIRSEESRFFEILRDLEARHKVAIGSYPQRGHILIRATGEKKAAEAAIEDLRTLAADHVG